MANLLSTIRDYILLIWNSKFIKAITTWWQTKSFEEKKLTRKQLDEIRRMATQECNSSWIPCLDEVCSIFFETLLICSKGSTSGSSSSSTISIRNDMLEFTDSWKIYGPLIKEAWIKRVCEDEVKNDFYLNWPEKLDVALPKMLEEVQFVDCLMQSEFSEFPNFQTLDARGKFDGDYMRLSFLRQHLENLDKIWKTQGKTIKNIWENVKKSTAYFIKDMKEIRTQVGMTSKELDEERRSFHETMISLEDDLKVKQSEIENMRRKFKSEEERRKTTEDVVAQLQREKEDLLLKMAKYMNVKISSDETDLEDIATRCRPAVVIEEYEQLCSDHWLLAKQHLEETSNLANDKQMILLAKIITKSTEVANRHRRNQEVTLKRLLLDPDSLGQFIHECEDSADHGSSKNTETGSEVTWEDCSFALGKDVEMAVGEIELSVQKLLKESCSTVRIANMVKETTLKVIKDLHFSKTFFGKPDGALELFVEACVRLAWKMALQRPHMHTTCTNVGQSFDENLQELNWGSASPGPDVVVLYYVYPTLLHGEQVKRKGKVMLGPKTALVTLQDSADSGQDVENETNHGLGSEEESEKHQNDLGEKDECNDKHYETSSEIESRTTKSAEDKLFSEKGVQVPENSIEERPSEQLFSPQNIAQQMDQDNFHAPDLATRQKNGQTGTCRGNAKENFIGERKMRGEQFLVSNEQSESERNVEKTEDIKGDQNNGEKQQEDTNTDGKQETGDGNQQLRNGTRIVEDCSQQAVSDTQQIEDGHEEAEDGKLMTKSEKQQTINRDQQVESRNKETQYESQQMEGGEQQAKDTIPQVSKEEDNEIGTTEPKNVDQQEPEKAGVSAGSGTGDHATNQNPSSTGIHEPPHRIDAHVDEVEASGGMQNDTPGSAAETIESTTEDSGEELQKADGASGISSASTGKAIHGKKQGSSKENFHGQKNSSKKKKNRKK